MSIRHLSYLMGYDSLGTASSAARTRLDKKKPTLLSGCVLLGYFSFEIQPKAVYE